MSCTIASARSAKSRAVSNSDASASRASASEGASPSASSSRKARLPSEVASSRSAAVPSSSPEESVSQGANVSTSASAWDACRASRVAQSRVASDSSATASSSAPAWRSRSVNRACHAESPWGGFPSSVRRTAPTASRTVPVWDVISASVSASPSRLAGLGHGASAVSRSPCLRAISAPARLPESTVEM